MAVTDMRSIGRNTQGVRLINLTGDDKLVSATTVEPEDEQPTSGISQSDTPSAPLSDAE